MTGSDLLAPFTPLDAYLWLGLAVGLGFGALVALVPSRGEKPRAGPGVV